MSTPSPNPTQGSNDQQTLTIVVAVTAGFLVIIVLLLCLVVFYLYSRKDKIAEKEVVEIDNRHRLFREPTNLSSRFDDIVELEATYFQGRDDQKKKSGSSKKSIKVGKEATRENPMFGKDDIYGDALESNTRSRKPTEENTTEGQNGITNLAVDITDEQDPPSQDDGNATPQGSPQHSGSGPASPTSPKLDILDPATWNKVEEGNEVETIGDVDDGEYEIPTLDRRPPTSDGGVSSGDEIIITETGDSPDVGADGGVLTISGKDPGSRADEVDLGDDGGEDGGEDERASDDDDTYHMYSPFQRSSSQRRRSFHTRNSAVIDFYEGGAPLSRVRTEDARAKSSSGVDVDAFWDSYKAPASSSDAQGLLWQNKRIF